MKMKMFFCFSVFLIQGCLAGRPSPPEFMLWNKSGDSPDDIKIALLECGANNPFGDVTPFPYPEGTALEMHAMVHMCMINSGYKYKSKHSICRSLPDLKACQEKNSENVRKHSYQIRLESDFCKSRTYSSLQICKP